jgi:hypothetical protein
MPGEPSMSARRVAGMKRSEKEEEGRGIERAVESASITRSASAKCGRRERG